MKEQNDGKLGVEVGGWLYSPKVGLKSFPIYDMLLS